MIKSIVIALVAASSVAASPFPAEFHFPDYMTFEMGNGATYHRLQARQLADNGTSPFPLNGTEFSSADSVSSEASASASASVSRFASGFASASASRVATITPAPSASLAPLLVTTDGLTLTFDRSEPEASTPPPGSACYKGCLIDISKVCTSTAECATKTDELEKLVCKNLDKSIECYKCMHGGQLSQSAETNITSNRRWCVAKGYISASGAVSTVVVSGSAVVAAVVGLASLL